MQGTFTIIKTNGDTITHPTVAKGPGLEQIQEAVGGWIEKVPFFDTYNNQRAVCYCNEEGKLDRLPYNEKATQLWQAQNQNRLDDALVGDVAILSGDKEFIRSLGDDDGDDEDDAD